MLSSSVLFGICTMLSSTECKVVVCCLQNEQLEDRRVIINTLEYDIRSLTKQKEDLLGEYAWQPWSCLSVLCMYVRTYVPKVVFSLCFVCMYVCVCMQTHTCAHGQTHVCKHTILWRNAMYVYVLYSYAHTHTHTHTHAFFQCHRSSL